MFSETVNAEWSPCPHLNPWTFHCIFFLSPAKEGSDRVAWWAPDSQPRSAHHTTKPTALQLSNTDAVWDHVKGLKEAKTHHTSCSCLPHKCGGCITEGHWISQVQFALFKAMCLALITSLSSICPDTASRRVWSMILSHTEISDWLMVPRVLFLTFLKSGVISPFFLITEDFAWLPWLYKYDGEKVSNCICQFPLMPNSLSYE